MHERRNEQPIASWLGLSRRNVCTIRGENWPIASWTTTIVMVSTSAASDTIEAAMVERIATAASGPPVSPSGTSLKSKALSIPDRAERQQRPGQHADDGDEPKARTDVTRELSHAHARLYPAVLVDGRDS